MTDKGDLVYLIKFYNYPVKQIHCKNYYEIAKKLEELITIYKVAPEWVVRQS